jgi:hypothetical protein
MAITKQIKLYWCTTADHDHDWFIFAESAGNARAYHEHCEGYDEGDANSRLIVSDVKLAMFMNGTPPCAARFEDLYQIGLEAGTNPGRRKGRFNGEIFQDGIIEAIIELGRQRQVLENDCLQVERGHVSTGMPEVETGPQLVS